MLTFAFAVALSCAPSDLADRLASAGFPGAKTDDVGAMIEVTPESGSLARAAAVLMRFEEAPDGAILVSAWPVRDGGISARTLARGTLEALLAGNRAREGAVAIDEDGDLCIVLRVDSARWRGPRLRRVLGDLIHRADELLETIDAAAPADTGGFTIELHWSGDVDLDLDLYHTASGAIERDSTHFASAGELPPDERDILEGDGEPERIRIDGRLAHDTFFIVASFWAAGPSGRTQAEARIVVLHASGEIEERRGVLTLPDRRHWFAARFLPGRARPEWIEPTTR